MTVRKFDLPIAQPKKLTQTELAKFNPSLLLGDKAEEIIKTIKHMVIDDILNINKELDWDYYEFPTSYGLFVVPKLKKQKCIVESSCGQIKTVEYISLEGIGLLGTFIVLRKYITDTWSCRAAYDTLCEYIKQHSDYDVLESFAR